MRHTISVVICTYNRVELIKNCIVHLLNAKLSEEIEIVVIDNYGSHELKAYILNFNHKKLRYDMEPHTGLSFARNRGYRISNNEWIVYLDDEAEVENDFFVKLNDIIYGNPNIALIGGNVESKFVFRRKWWMPDDFYYFFKNSPCKVLGGLMAIHREKCKDIKFGEDLGMQGMEIGFGEDTQFQLEVQKRGMKVQCFENWKVKHVERKEKHEFKWHMVSFKKQSETRLKMYKVNTLFQFVKVLGSILNIASSPLIITFKYFSGQSYRNYVYWSIQNIYINCRMLLLKLGLTS